MCMKCTQAAVTVRVMMTLLPTWKPAALETGIVSEPEGRYVPVILTLFAVAGEPEPAILTARLTPDVLISVPPVPEPLPRRTTPLAVMVRVLLMWKVPAARRTAPRKPPEIGIPETELI